MRRWVTLSGKGKIPIDPGYIQINQYLCRCTVIMVCLAGDSLLVYNGPMTSCDVDVSPHAAWLGVSFHRSVQKVMG